MTGRQIGTALGIALMLAGLLALLTTPAPAEPAETWSLAEWLAMDDDRALALIRYGPSGDYQRALVYADGTPIFFLR